jgi:hypothetical protein
MDKIWRKTRDYSTATYSLPRVCREVINLLKSEGYDVSVVDDKHRDYRIIQIEDQQWKIVRNNGWSQYDVLMID